MQSYENMTLHNFDDNATIQQIQIDILTWAEENQLRVGFANFSRDSNICILGGSSRIQCKSVSNDIGPSIGCYEVFFLKMFSQYLVPLKYSDLCEDQLIFHFRNIYLFEKLIILITRINSVTFFPEIISKIHISGQLLNYLA